MIPINQNKETHKRLSENIKQNQVVPNINRERSPSRNKRSQNEYINQPSLIQSAVRNEHTNQPSSPKIKSVQPIEVHKTSKSPQHQTNHKNNHLNSNNTDEHQSHLAGKRKSLKKTKQAYTEIDSNNETFNTPHKVQQTPKQPHKSHLTPTRNTLKSNERIFIALYNYDPITMSPNIDSCNEELGFKEGQLIKVIGDQDADGFFFGVTQGKSGYIPCNLISEVQVDDPVILEQLISEINCNSKS